MVLLKVLLDRDWIDDRLYPTSDARWAKCKQEFPDLVFDHLFGIHVFKYVNAVERNKDLVDFK